MTPSDSEPTNSALLPGPDSLPARRILAVVTTGGFTHAATCPPRSANPAPDLILADFFAEAAAKDMMVQFGIPVARAILNHPHCRLYLTHGGGSSANEAFFHGTPVLTLGFFFDQLCYSARLAAAGVGLQLNKTDFSSQEICDKVGLIFNDVVDVDGNSHSAITRNMERMRLIARVASHRKHLAADLIEEVLYDTELRVDVNGHQLRPMHLQMADSRMSVWRAKNWDLWLLGGCAVVLPLGLVFAIDGVRARKGDVHSGLMATCLGRSDSVGMTLFARKPTV
ncbi:udp-glucosyl transferase family protein [Grosmannia clavigera kw1407]|uniref:Udp-glucosyl transferase family protein n=1 Tax=Grosmannia clavigera (strain kw1407 / UAMH 11150) TaxID=655863 RepID=F0XNN0_GROCL|nr:udp-glucosyl transferase family protein [Grosmannia clavigera kw1407]EFX00160.1 udp-glucosyl transferase family protein [Grosmannia clavigera kw1407]